VKFMCVSSVWDKNEWSYSPTPLYALMAWTGTSLYFFAGLNDHVSVCFIPAIFRSSLQEYKRDYIKYMPISVAARYKAWVCSHSLAEIAGSNPAGGMDVCLSCMLCVVR